MLELYPIFLVATVGIEALVTFVWIRLGRFDHQLRWLFALLGTNLIAHPIAWLSYSYGVNYWVVEGAVVVFEALLLAALIPASVWKTAPLSLVMNICSAAFGWLPIWTTVLMGPK